MKQGFRLVELAIVIIIIGLLVGRVLHGQELITQARIKSQISQVREYETAHFSFKAKYNCLAGDCNNLASYFTGLINGNGNGDLDNDVNASYDTGGTWSGSTEYQNFFKSFSRGGFIKGSYGKVAQAVYLNYL